MWTEITRPKYERKGSGYTSDLSDAEWALIEPRLPKRKRLGRPPKTERRNVVNALLYLIRAACPWRLLPKDFPPVSTVQHYFYAWRDSGVLERINFELLLQAREAAGRAASPSAGVIDSQSVKTTEAGGPRGFDAAKKVKGHPMNKRIGGIAAALSFAAISVAHPTVAACADTIKYRHTLTVDERNCLSQILRTGFWRGSPDVHQ